MLCCASEILEENGEKYFLLPCHRESVYSVNVHVLASS